MKCSCCGNPPETLPSPSLAGGSNIEMFLHCKDCGRERPDGLSPRDFESIEVGITAQYSIQVWCKRHDKKVFEYSLLDKPL